MSDQSDSDTNESNDDGAAAQSEQGVPPQLRIERIFLKEMHRSSRRLRQKFFYANGGQS